MNTSTAEFQARSAMLRGFVGQAREYGLDPDALAREAGVDPAALRGGDLHLPAAKMAALYELAAERAGAPDFALKVVAHRRMSNLGSVALLAREARTLRQALRTIQRYIWVQNEAVDLSIDEAGPATVLLQAVPQIGAGKQATDLFVGMMLVAIRYLIGFDWTPRAILLPYKQPADLEIYRKTFGVVPRFDQDLVGLLIPASDLGRSVLAADPDFVSDLQGRIETETVARQAGFIPGVRSLIAQQLRLGNERIDLVAATLGMSPRSLQRQLAEHGATFSDLVDETRRVAVVPLLLDADRSLGEVSSLLGFSDGLAFNRWFEQRFDSSPSAYRTQKLGR